MHGIILYGLLGIFGGAVIGIAIFTGYMQISKYLLDKREKEWQEMRYSWAPSPQYSLTPEPDQHSCVDEFTEQMKSVRGMKYVKTYHNGGDTLDEYSNRIISYYLERRSSGALRFCTVIPKRFERCTDTTNGKPAYELPNAL